MTERSHIISYLKTGYLLHLVTLSEITLIFFCFQYWQIGQWLTAGHFAWKLALISPLLIAPVFPQLDARSRYQNYKQVKDHLYKKGFEPRLVKLFSQTRCQRCAAWVAADELGMGDACK